MSVYKKLQQARIKLQATELKKSGHNKFAGYQYFELGDFLPAIQTIFAELGLCGAISFTRELATLEIVDVDDGSKVVFTSPMEQAVLKGCHPIQNLGAAETYQRRYLWVTAMEIVEHDALEPLTNPDEEVSSSAQHPKKKTHRPTDGALDALDDRRRRQVEKLAAGIQAQYEAGNEWNAWEMWDLRDKNLFDVDASTAVWDQLDSKCRAYLKHQKQLAEQPVAA